MFQIQPMTNQSKNTEHYEKILRILYSECKSDMQSLIIMCCLIRRYFFKENCSSQFRRKSRCFKENCLSLFRRKSRCFKENCLPLFRRKSRCFTENCLSLFRRKSRSFKENCLSIFRRKPRCFIGELLVV